MGKSTKEPEAKKSQLGLYILIKMELQDEFTTILRVKAETTADELLSILSKRKSLNKDSYFLAQRDNSGKTKPIPANISVGSLPFNHLILLPYLDSPAANVVSKCGSAQERNSVNCKILRKNMFDNLKGKGLDRFIFNKSSRRISDEQESGGINNPQLRDLPEKSHSSTFSIFLNREGSTKGLRSRSTLNLSRKSSVRSNEIRSELRSLEESNRIPKKLLSKVLLGRTASKLSLGDNSAEIPDLCKVSATGASLSESDICSGGGCENYLRYYLKYAYLDRGSSDIQTGFAKCEESPDSKDFAENDSANLDSGVFSGTSKQNLPSHSETLTSCTVYRGAEPRTRKSFYSLGRGYGTVKLGTSYESTNVGYVKLIIFPPNENKYVQMVASRFSTVEQVLRTVCNDLDLDFDEHTLELPNGSYVELDSYIDAWDNSVSDNLIKFNITKSGKIYKFMSFIREGRKVLSVLSSNGRLKVTLGEPNILVDIAVFPIGCNKITSEYIDALILTSRAYMSPDILFLKLVSLIPGFNSSEVDLLENAQGETENPDSYEEGYPEAQAVSSEYVTESTIASRNDSSDESYTNGCLSKSDTVSIETKCEDYPERKRSSVVSTISCSDQQSVNIPDTSITLETKPELRINPRILPNSSNPNLERSPISRDAPKIENTAETLVTILGAPTVEKDVIFEAVISFIIEWLNICYLDFELYPQLMKRLEGFLESCNKHGNSAYAKECSNIREIVARNKVAYHNMVSNYKYVTGKSKTITGMISSLNSEDISKQLCLYNHAVMRVIHPVEFLNRIWNTKNIAFSPTMTYFIERFDIESYWAATEILSILPLKKRASIMKKFIKVGYQCLMLNNFFSAFSIASGLNSPPISRLKKTWGALSDKTRTTWEYLVSFTDPSKNMKNYRCRLSCVKPPILPFLPIYLKDLIFMNDGNETIIHESECINFDKLAMISEHVNGVRSFVSVDYPFKPLTHIQNLLKKPPVIKDLDKLMEMSYKCEPRAVYRTLTSESSAPPNRDYIQT